MLAKDGVNIGRPGLAAGACPYVAHTLLRLTALCGMVNERHGGLHRGSELVSLVVEHRLSGVVILGLAGLCESVFCIERDQRKFPGLELLAYLSCDFTEAAKI